MNDKKVKEVKVSVNGLPFLALFVVLAVLKLAWAVSLSWWLVILSLFIPIPLVIVGLFAAAFREALRDESPRLVIR